MWFFYFFFFFSVLLGKKEEWRIHVVLKECLEKELTSQKDGVPHFPQGEIHHHSGSAVTLSVLKNWKINSFAECVWVCVSGWESVVNQLLHVDHQFDYIHLNNTKQCHAHCIHVVCEDRIQLTQLLPHHPSFRSKGDKWNKARFSERKPCTPCSPGTTIHKESVPGSPQSGKKSEWVNSHPLSLSVSLRFELQKKQKTKKTTSSQG